MPLTPNTKIFHLNARAFGQGYKIIVNQGGTSSSKTYSTLQVLAFFCTKCNMGLVSVVSESLPHLKRGCIRDFQSVMGELFDDNKFNKTDFIYNFDDYGTDSKIEFFSADQADKLRGGRRKHLFINEANNNSKDVFDQLDVRTSGTTWIDFNPSADFWAHDLLQQNGITDYSRTQFPANKNICFIHSTYQDAKDVLPQSTIEKIESRREADPNWWRVYGLGLVGKIDGLIHPNFSTVDEFPVHGNIEGYGLDFGFNDPVALVRCKIMNEYLVCDEVVYETGLTNGDLAKRMTAAGLIKGRTEIIADCAEPKSIEELHRMGWNIKPAIKGADSVVAGIQKVNQYKQVWTTRSTNGIKEQRNYMWMRDKNGKILDVPSATGFDHCMDARRYWVGSKTLGPAPGQALRIAI